MSTPPPPPGSGGNQPYDPTGQGSTPGQPPAYGSQQPPAYGQGQQYGSGMPPQAPPPAPGGFPQDGGDASKAKNFSIASIVLGLIGCCCWPLAIGGLVLGILGKKEAEKAGQPTQLAMIGIVLSAIFLALGVILGILQLAGVVDVYSFNFETS